MPSIGLLVDKLVALHAAKPQETMRVRGALAQAAEALIVLGSLGHQFHLAHGPAVDTFEDEYPRLVFHVDAAPNGRLVRGAAEEAELGGRASGWHRSLEAAQHADGMDTQFAGRGGVGRKSLPATLPESKALDPSSPEAVAARAAHRAAVRAEFVKGKSDAGI